MSVTTGPGVGDAEAVGSGVGVAVARLTRALAVGVGLASGSTLLSPHATTATASDTQASKIRAKEHLDAALRRD